MKMRLMTVALAALLLAGCAGGMQLGGTSSGARPKTILVTDFIFADVTAVDRGFTTRLERKVGHFPTHERKQRTLERVNDEIVATIVAGLREAGFEAQPGSDEGLSFSDEAVIVSGRLRASDANISAAKKNQVGIGAGLLSVTADMTVSRFAGGGRKQLTTFTADGGGKRSAGNAKQAAAHNNAIASALAASNAAKEKLSPDVEAQARRIGRVAADKIVAFAKEQGWMNQPGEAVEAAPAAAPDEKPARLPPQRPGKKPPKPAADEEDPDKDG